MERKCITSLSFTTLTLTLVPLVQYLLLYYTLKVYVVILNDLFNPEILGMLSLFTIQCNRRSQ